MGRRQQEAESAPPRSLYELCETAANFEGSPEELDQIWESIRQCLAAHPSFHERQLDAKRRGNDGTAAIHLLCKSSLGGDPPLDILDALILCSPETVEWQDANGWLPLHHATANKASIRVLKRLVDAYPAGALAQDARQRTPLHFAFVDPHNDDDEQLGDDFENEDEFRDNAEEEGGRDDGENDSEEDDRNGGGSSRTEIVDLLGNNGAAHLPDENGMLPMHYACAYGNSTSILEALREDYPGSIAAGENGGRTPLHLAMANAYRRTGPSVVEFLTRHGSAGETSGLVDIADDRGRLPLHVLAGVCKSRAPMPENERVNASKCLALYLDARPSASPEFLEAMRETPEWLRVDAVLIRYGWREVDDDHQGNMLPFVANSDPKTQSICFGDDHVREGINKLFIKRPVLAVMMCDLYCQVLLVAAVSGASSQTAGQEDGGMSKWHLGMLILAVFWFALREIIQMISSPFKLYITDAWNWVDMLQISLVVASLAVMHSNNGINDSHRALLTVTIGIVWFALLGVLKNFLYGVSVFLSSLQQILVTLIPFMVVTAVTVAAFVFMLHTSNNNTNYCSAEDGGEDDEQAWYCGTLGQLFGDLLAFVLSLKEIEIETNSPDAIAITNGVLYAFGFIIALILLNVLIAKISNVFSEVEEKGDYFFWEDRVSVLTEAESLLHLLQKGIKFISSGCKRNSSSDMSEPRVFKRLGRVLHNFDAKDEKSSTKEKIDDTQDSILLSGEDDRGDRATPLVVLRRLLAPLVHVCFFVAGCISFGLLWPKWMASAMFSGKYENFDDLKGDISNVQKQMATNVEVLERKIAGIKEAARSNNDSVEERIGRIEDALGRIEGALGALLDKQ